MSDFEIHVDISDAERELSRFADGVETAEILALESALSAAFQATQAHVHVITGALKASGRIDSRHDSDEWHGEIEYGATGPSAEYADYEQRRHGTKDGTSHDFLEPAKALDGTFGEAIEAYVKDEI